MTPLLDTTQLSEVTGIPKRTLDQYAYLGTGPAFVKLGGHRRYRQSQVEEWLDANTRGGGTA